MVVDECVPFHYEIAARERVYYWADADDNEAEGGEVGLVKFLDVDELGQKIADWGSNK